MIDQVLSTGLVPDIIIRRAIKSFLDLRIKEDLDLDAPGREAKMNEMISILRTGPIAVETDKANDQHYMVPPAFFEACLGKKLKYSSAYWPEGVNNLDQAEEKMLEETCLNAGLKDGQRVLELGHGWGSLTLYMAEKFPNSEIKAISNSSEQRLHIEAQAKRRGLTNIEIQTCDMNDFDAAGMNYDRVVSVEMFEHMRNYEDLLKRISSWLHPEGAVFVHIFVHKNTPYLFEAKDDTDWMSKYFFSGGLMPSNHLLYYFNEDLRVVDHKVYSGIHYAKTARAWLENMDHQKVHVMDIFKDHYGEKEARKWFEYWRVFFMSCEELWQKDKGNEWFVSHYLLKKNFSS